MTMPKFEPVGYRDASGDYHYANTSRGDYVALYTSNQITEAYEAGKLDASEDLEQAAFEKWLYDKCPSGDVESVQRQWLESYEYAELVEKLEQAAHIEMMREALSKIEYLESANGCIMSAGDCSSVATEALSATPDEALEQFAAKVREQCAKLCDDLVSDYPSRTDITATQCADAIRAIKELP